MSEKLLNCFCLDTNTKALDGETAMPAEAFASGKVAYLLDGVGDRRTEYTDPGKEGNEAYNREGNRQGYECKHKGSTGKL